MPGVNVNITNAPAPSSRPTETGKLFAIGVAERGPVGTQVTVHSINELKNVFGTAVAGSYLISGLEEFFLEGGATVIVGRAVGATSVVASAVVQNAAKSATAFNVTAEGPGAYGNHLEVTIKNESGSLFSITVSESGTELEKITGLGSISAAQEWSLTSPFVNIVEVKAELPAAGTVSLVGGADGEAIAALGSATYAKALGLFNKDLGCGQVAAPGVSTAAVQELLLSHAEANDRLALVDCALGATAAELKAAALSLRTKIGARRGQTFSSWATIPGLSPGTTRKVPWSCVQAGLIAVNDGNATPPPVNIAVAGINAIPINVIGLSAEFQRAERDELSEARVCPIRNVPITGIETYGVVTLANPIAEPAWEQVTAARLFMYVAAEGEQILEKLMFGEIDPHGLLFARASGALTLFLESLGNQLYNPASTAVNTGSSVNTPETIHKKQLNASVLVQPSPAVEAENLNITAKGV